MEDHFDSSDNDLHIDKVGVQTFFVEVECHKHVRAAIETIEKAGMTVMTVTPLVDYDPLEDYTALRAVVITVAAEARESLRVQK